MPSKFYNKIKGQSITKLHDVKQGNMLVDKMNKVAINTATNKEEPPTTEITRCPIKPIKYKL
jgi:hypothetical protein